MQKAKPTSGRSSSGLQFFSMVFVLLIIGVLVYLNKSALSGDDGQAQETQAAPAVDPFADLPEEVFRGEKGPLKDAGPDPFGDLERLTDHDLWKAALATATEAEGLMQEALDALEAGRRDAARTKGKEAQALFSKAVSSTDDWEAEIGRARGFDDPEVKSISRARTNWNRQVMALKKTAGI